MKVSVNSVAIAFALVCVAVADRVPELEPAKDPSGYDASKQSDVVAMPELNSRANADPEPMTSTATTPKATATTSGPQSPATPTPSSGPTVVKKGGLDAKLAEADDQNLGPESATGSVVPKKGLDSPTSLASDASLHHHAGRRIVPKKGVDEGEERTLNQDGEPATTDTTSTEKSTTVAAPDTTSTQSGDDFPKSFVYNATTGQQPKPDDKKPAKVENKKKKKKVLPSIGNVPHVADIPKVKPVPKSDEDTRLDPSTPNTGLLVGAVFSLILLSAAAFLVFKRVRAAQRRREYRRMNDFLIDGMYNDL